MDNVSIASDIVSLHDDTSLQNLDDEDPFASPRLQAIFSQGIIVQEVANGNKTEEFVPQVFTESLLKDHQHTLKHFSESGVQRDFITKSIQEASKSKSCRYRFDKTKPVPIVQTIESRFSKGDKQVSFLRRDFVLPAIKSEYLDEVASGLEIYIQDLLEELSLSSTLTGTSINKQATMKNLAQLADKAASKLSSNAARKTVYSLLLQCSALETSVIDGRHDLCTFIKTQTLGITDSRRGGSFMRIDSHADTVKNRLQSMIVPGSVAAAISIKYKLKHSQLLQLVQYIFSKDVEKRTEAKINLLSSTNDYTRSDLVLSPEKVLIRSIEENYLTRQEIVALFFHDAASQRTDSGRRCVHCEFVITAHPDKFQHVFCPVAEWLVNHFEFQYSNGYLVIPSYIYLSEEVAQYARKVIQLETDKRLTPYIARSEHDFRVMSLTDTGQPKTVAHLGSKPVKVTNFPNQPRSSGTHYNLRS